MKLRLKEVEWIDQFGRLCVNHYWSWVEAYQFASTVPTLIEVREQQ